MKQCTLDLRTWGGRRRGAGRKPARERSGVPHRARELRSTQPVHVSLRVADHVWNLRSDRSFQIIHAALEAVRARPDFKVAHFSIQGNHVHLIVEASGARGLANGMRSLAIRIARRLNQMMGTSGSVFEERFHAHVLRTPTEVRNALRYVAENHERHLQRLGQSVAKGTVDRYSSAAARGPARGQLSLWGERTTQSATTWLLRTVELPSPELAENDHIRRIKSPAAPTARHVDGTTSP